MQNAIKKVTSDDGAKSASHELVLSRPPQKPGEKAWWEEDFTVRRKIRDRELFA